MTMYVCNDTDPGQGPVGSVFYRGIEIHYDEATGTKTVCTVPLGCVVVDVLTFVKEVCDGSPTLTIGDGDDVDGFLISSDIAPGTALSVTVPAVVSSRDTDLTTAAYNGHKYYPTGDTVDAVWTKGTSPTTGSIVILVAMVNISRMGLAAGLASTSVPI